MMEGTTIGRTDSEEGFASETELVSRFVDLFHRTAGMPLVVCSGQNIDRIVTIFHACKRVDRQFIIDMYTAEVLRATGIERIPQAEWSRIEVFLPKSQKWRIMREQRFDISDSYHSERIYHNQLATVTPRSVMLFRPSMTKDVEEAKCLTGTSCIYSLWRGYLKDEKQRPFLAWLDRHSIPLHRCHTSGHASTKELRAFRNAFSGAPVVPIHLDDIDGYCRLFDDVVIRADGEWWTV